jgi:hypothetical protein
VVHFEALLQATQDRDGVLDTRLIDDHRLEATFERRVLLDVLAVLIERRSADAVQFSAREHGLEHVARIHRAIGLARSDDRVQFVDEQEDAPLTVLDLGEHGLQPLLELAAVLGAGDEASHVERKHRLVLEPFGDVAAHDALGQPFGDRSLADTRFANEYGVVLGLARQDADHTADLLIAPDHRIHLALLGHLHEVAAVPFERFVGDFGVGALHPLVAAHFLERVQEPRFVDRERLDDVAQTTLRSGEDRQEQVLDRDILVPHLAGLLLGRGHHLGEFLREEDLVRREPGPRHARQLAQLRFDRSLHDVVRHLHAFEQASDEPVLGFDETKEEVRDVDLLMTERHRLGLGKLQGFLRLLGQFLGVHACSSLSG